VNKRLEHFILDLENWNRKATCYFCSGFMNRGSKAVCQIRTRNKITGELVANACACENCKEKFENEELPKCERCERLQTESNVDVRSGKFICDCIRNNENIEEKELPHLPQQRESMSVFYERQINSLQEEKNQLIEEVTIHLEALEVAEDWHKRQKQELLDRIKELEAENKRLKEKTPQELLDEISRLKERVRQLEEKNDQLENKVEVKNKILWFRRK
jgi:DNA repair exonuclease SbcCD ATPase subunit